MAIFHRDHWLQERSYLGDDHLETLISIKQPVTSLDSSSKSVALGTQALMRKRLPRRELRDRIRSEQVSQR